MPVVKRVCAGGARSSAGTGDRERGRAGRTGLPHTFMCLFCAHGSAELIHPRRQTGPAEQMPTPTHTHTDHSDTAGQTARGCPGSWSLVPKSRPSGSPPQEAGGSPRGASAITDPGVAQEHHPVLDKAPQRALSGRPGGLATDLCGCPGASRQRNALPCAGSARGLGGAAHQAGPLPSLATSMPGMFPASSRTSGRNGP